MIFFYLFIIGVPAILVFFAIKKLIQLKVIHKKGIKTNAVITQITLNRSSKGSSQSLIMEYADRTGIRYTAKATITTGQYQHGNIMPLKYLDNKPSQYAIDGMLQGQWFILVFLVVLLAFAIFASYKINEMAQSGDYRFTGF